MPAPIRVKLNYMAFQNPNKIFLHMEPWHTIPTCVYLDHAAFYKAETHCGVCPYADQRENLRFIARVKVK